MEQKRWYVVRTISGKEKKAKEYIEGEVAKRNWQDIIPQVLVPMEKVYTIKNGKKVLKERTIFSGYVLIEAALTKEVESVIQNLPEILDFLRDRNNGKGSAKGNPQAMRESEIKRIMGDMDAKLDANATIVEKFIVGEAVKVIDGPFNSFSGVVEEVFEEKRKLKVTVKIFGRKTPLELSFSQVEKE